MTEEETVYEGTPLAGYLNETQTVEDWGIESFDGLSAENSDEESNSTPRVDDAANPVSDASQPTNGRFLGPNKQRIPLVLGNGRLFTEEERFRQSLRSLLGQKVSFEETNRFLDQFRYIIISSSLLEQQPLFNTWSVATDVRRRRFLFDQSMPWTHLYVEPVFKATGGGGIVALCVLLHYKYRTAPTSADRATAAIIITIAVIIYFFATSRRRLLRSLRRRALIYIEMFTQSAKFFDGDCVRALRNLQDIDIVSHGFAPNSRPNFLMARSQPVAGRKMRSILASALHLLKVAYLDAFKDCVCMGPKASLEQFLNIYDLKSEMVALNFELSEDFIGFVDGQTLPYDGPEACFAQVADLKRELQKVHMLRRALLCCLLAVESTGKSTVNELEVWTTLCDHLLNANNLAEQLSSLITSERRASEQQASVEDERRKLLNQRQNVPSSFVDVLVQAKHLSARLDVVNDAADLDSKQAAEQINALEEEITDLSAKWKKFIATHRNKETAADNATGQQRGPSSSRSFSTDTIIAPSPTLIMTPESSEMTTFSASGIPELIDSTSETTMDSSHPSFSIIEGEAPAFVLPRSDLSRDERIQIAKRNRENAKTSVAMATRRSSLALELNSVLSRRH